MRNPLRNLIPSMFHRRLLLLVALMAVVSGVLALRLIYLTVARGAWWRQRAESVLVQRTFIDTVRGRILDRHGQVLARDEPAYDAAVHYRVLSGRWAYDRARLDAADEHRSQWYQWDERQREEAIKAFLPPYETQVQELWALLAQAEGVPLAEIEQRRAAIVARVQRLATYIWANRRRQARESNQDIRLRDVAGPVAEQQQFHSVVSGIDAPTRLSLGKLVAQYSGDRQSVWRQVRVIDSQRRAYPLESITIELDRSHFPTPLRQAKPVELTIDGVALHAVGQLRRMWESDEYLEQQPFITSRLGDLLLIDYRGYREGDLVGAWGAERSAEPILRGTRGEQVVNRETHTTRRREPTAGQDITLTLDVRLQARIAAVMSQDERVGLMRRQFWHSASASEDVKPEPLDGAAVVLDIASGEVLAAVTVPGFSMQDLREKPVEFWSSEWSMRHRPRVYRPIATPYPPGSTIKPLVLSAAYTDRKIGYDSTIICNGALDMDHPLRNRCWIFKAAMIGHGPLDGPEAIRRSCNVFFYTLGQRFGIGPLVRWYERFGLGHETGCGLGAEHDGILPRLEPRPTASAEDAIQMAIGQGPVEWTVLQAANAYATLARQGRMLPPTFIRRAADQPVPALDLHLDQRGVQLTLQGLDEAVNTTGGTGHVLHRVNDEVIFNLPGVQVAGKSGTAWPGKVAWFDLDADGKVSANELEKDPGDHAWFIGIITRPKQTRPAYVVAVIVEYAGSGGAAAGPIANQILYALRAEGYL